MTRGTPTTPGWKRLLTTFMMRTAHRLDSSDSMPVNSLRILSAAVMHSGPLGCEIVHFFKCVTCTFVFVCLCVLIDFATL